MRSLEGQLNITSKNESLYVIKLLPSHFSRSISSFLEARAANLIPEGKGIMSNTDDKICARNKKYELRINRAQN